MLSFSIRKNPDMICRCASTLRKRSVTIFQPSINQLCALCVQIKAYFFLCFVRTLLISANYFNMRCPPLYNFLQRK